MRFNLKINRCKPPKIDKKNEIKSISKKEITAEDLENHYQQYSHYDLGKIIKFFQR